MNKEKTYRGFDFASFTDYYGSKCSLQKSSLVDAEAIWLGVDDVQPQIMASRTPEGGVGWVPFHIPDDVNLTTRMHLTREQVAELIPHLQKFVDTGDI